MIEDATAPGGYRIEGTLRLPIALNSASANERAADQAKPDQRLRMLVAGEGYRLVDSWRGDEVDVSFPVAA